jgi:glycine oxidase
MPDHPDVLIIGGGVIGLTAAYYLAREQVQVQVIDRGDLGQEASWAGAGILLPGSPGRPPAPLDQLRAASASLYPELSAELKELTGLDNGYLRSGGIEFGSEEETATREWRGEGIAFRAIERDELRRLEPGVNPRHDRAFLVPDMAQVRNPRHVKALLAACEKLGVHLRPGCPVETIEHREGHVTALRTGAGRLGAGRFLIAAGAWCDSLLGPLGWRSGIAPVRGQIVLLHPTASPIQRILMEGKRYLVPRADGRVLIGSTEEDAGFDKRTTASAIRSLLDFAVELVPALAEAPVERAWAGLRPGSPDELPFIGPVPGLDNLFVAAGHFRAGLQLSPATGLLLKELFLGRPLTVPLDAFRLDRVSASHHRAAFRS